MTANHAPVVTAPVGGTATYGGLALIRNLHGLRDRLLDNFADRPGGWRRSDHHDPPHDTGRVRFRLSFEYVSKTPSQAAVIGWIFLLTGLFIAAIGILVVVAALLGAVE